MMKVDEPRTHFNLPVISAAAVQAPPEPGCPEIFRGPDDTDEATGLSSDLRLADEAVRAAAPGGGVRPDVVAKARALLASGQLGANLDRLAERLIESLIEGRDGDR